MMTCLILIIILYSSAFHLYRYTSGIAVCESSTIICLPLLFVHTVCARQSLDETNVITLLCVEYQLYSMYWYFKRGPYA